jgi:hypothetical protein
MCQTRVHVRINMDMNKYLCLNMFAHNVFTCHICRIVKLDDQYIIILTRLNMHV